jgi:hypothetical protein
MRDHFVAAVLNLGMCGRSIAVVLNLGYVNPNQDGAQWRALVITVMNLMIAVVRTSQIFWLVL